MIFSPTFCFWIVFSLLFWCLVNFLILGLIWQTVPGPGTTYDSPSVFSEASLLANYYESIRADPFQYLNKTIDDFKKSCPTSLTIKYNNSISGDVRFSSGTHYLSVLSQTKLNSTVVSIERDSGSNPRPILFYANLNDLSGYRGNANGIVAFSVMLELLEYIMSNDLQTHPLQHPVYFFFDYQGAQTGFAALRSWIEKKTEFVIVLSFSFFICCT